MLADASQADQGAGSSNANAPRQLSGRQVVVSDIDVNMGGMLRLTYG